MKRNTKDEFLVTVTRAGETINARCESETQARYLISLLADPPGDIEGIKLHRVRGITIVGGVLLSMGVDAVD